MDFTKLFAFLTFVAICQGHSDIAQNLARLIQHVANPDELYIPPTRETPQNKEKTTQHRAVGDPPKVMTTSGEAEGISNDIGHAFYQIPYAEPPIGLLRWQPPVPIQNPTAFTASVNEGLQCHQFEVDCLLPTTIIECRKINMDEDCLVLNVFVPKYIDLFNSTFPPTERLPVMFYIHGGFFYAGAGTRTSLDGQELANVTNTVVVTINYRLGPLGFLYHVEEGKDDINGNQGLKDQQLAMKWVQDNIANFGGDKTKVTLFGNSAGAQSIMFHTLSDVSKSLYSGAIQQSNPAVFKYPTPEESLKITGYLTTSLRCNESESMRDCLMDAEPRAIINRLVPVSGLALLNGDVDTLIEPYRPLIDGVEFTKQPLALFKDGKWNSEKNMIVGVTTEELEDIQFYLPENLTVGRSLFTVVNYIIFGPEKTDTVVKKYETDYPPGPGEDWAVTFGIEMTHLFFICPSRAMARYASESTTGEKKVYFFADDHPVLDRVCVERNDGNAENCYYATHADEIEFVFRTTNSILTDDLIVEDQFSTYWGSFARTGNPSNNLETPLGDYPDWPHYTSQNGSFLKSIKLSVNEERSYDIGQIYGKILPILVQSNNIDEKTVEMWQNIRIKAPISEIETEYEDDICDFWDSIGYYMDPIPLPTTTTISTTTTEGNPTEPPPETTTSNARPLTYSTVLNLVFFSIFIFMP
uniref:crystal protein-like isoform X1 n=2 Tax=Styela clava TaxID=7725 RepID=UPI00193998D7|nr:crystal protein-like isoform X1 [Styela clava]